MEAIDMPLKGAYFTGVETPEQAAQVILDSVWNPGFLRPPIPVDPVGIALKLGIRVYTAQLDEKVSGVLVKHAGQDPEIHLQSQDSENRQRFTCAHELGHYWKRVTAGDDEWGYVDQRGLLASQGDDPDEIFANKFAAALLMPKSEVAERIRETPDEVGLAYQFSVSADAMHFRLINLRIKPPNPPGAGPT